ncbi:hypothetical protein GCM10009864_25510 [Streptomyces lunalinharesii]|uniref:Uncharacterized protein n=1 Tax=Streptomyces lunalinharesii TaxID=333384 RepID=A0ABN3RPU4_9ACTN
MVLLWVTSLLCGLDGTQVVSVRPYPAALSAVPSGSALPARAAGATLVIGVASRASTMSLSPRGTRYLMFTGAFPARSATALGVVFVTTGTAVLGSSTKQLAAVSSQELSTRVPLQLRPPSCPGSFTVRRASHGRAASPDKAAPGLP